MLRGALGTHHARMKTVLGLIVVVGLVVLVYTHWAKPHVSGHVPHGPQTVVIQMPNPGGG
jgi:hypothetical protein